MKAFLLGLAVLATMLGIVMLGARSRPWGTVKVVNGTSRDLWVCVTPVGGGSTFESRRVSPGGESGFFLDHVQPQDTFEVVAFDDDPGPTRPNVSVPANPVKPVVRASVAGARLLQTRSIGAVRMVIGGEGGKVTLRTE